MRCASVVSCTVSPSSLFGLTDVFPRLSLSKHDNLRNSYPLVKTLFPTRLQHSHIVTRSHILRPHRPSLGVNATLLGLVLPIKKLQPLYLSSLFCVRPINSQEPSISLFFLFPPRRVFANASNVYRCQVTHRS
jgi:hypothetical protein